MSEDNVHRIKSEIESMFNHAIKRSPLSDNYWISTVNDINQLSDDLHESISISINPNTYTQCSMYKDGNGCITISDQGLKNRLRVEKVKFKFEKCKFDPGDFIERCKSVEFSECLFTKFENIKISPIINFLNCCFKNTQRLNFSYVQELDIAGIDGIKEFVINDLVGKYDNNKKIKLQGLDLTSLSLERLHGFEHIMLSDINISEPKEFKFKDIRCNRISISSVLDNTNNQEELVLSEVHCRSLAVEKSNITIKNKKIIFFKFIDDLCNIFAFIGSRPNIHSFINKLLDSLKDCVGYRNIDHITVKGGTNSKVKFINISMADISAEKIEEMVFENIIVNGQRESIIHAPNFFKASNCKFMMLNFYSEEKFDGQLHFKKNKFEKAPRFLKCELPKDTSFMGNVIKDQSQSSIVIYRDLRNKLLRSGNDHDAAVFQFS